MKNVGKWHVDSIIACARSLGHDSLRIGQSTFSLVKVELLLFLRSPQIQTHKPLNISSLRLSKIFWIHHEILSKYRASHPFDFALNRKKTPSIHGFSLPWTCHKPPQILKPLVIPTSIKVSRICNFSLRVQIYLPLEFQF